MQVTHPNLVNIISRLGRARRSWARALAHNFRFDGRTDGARGDAYQADCPPSAATSKALRMSHAAYIDTRICVPAEQTPETFLAVNAAALIPRQEDQTLIRVESLVHAMAWKDPVAGSLLDCFQQARDESKSPSHPDRVAAERALASFMRSWNDDRDGRPMFATFRDCVADEAAADDWPHRLRDRLGLGHLNPAAPPGILIGLIPGFWSG